MARVTVENIKIDEYGLYGVVKIAARVATTLAQGSAAENNVTSDSGFKGGNKDAVNSLRLLEAGIEDPKNIENVIIDSMRKKKLVEDNTEEVNSVGADDEFFNDINATDMINNDFSDFSDVSSSKVDVKIDDDIFSDDNDI